MITSTASSWTAAPNFGAQGRRPRAKRNIGGLRHLSHPIHIYQYTIIFLASQDPRGMAVGPQADALVPIEDCEKLASASVIP